MTCNCPKCSYVSTPAVEPMLTPPMFYLRQEYDGQTFAITSPTDLSSKPGGVIATTTVLQLLMKSGTAISRRVLSASSLAARGCRCSPSGS